MIFAWGTVICSRCDRGGMVVVEEDEGEPRLSGFECSKCGGHTTARFIWRGGACTTEALAVKRAEEWQAAALAEREPPKPPTTAA